MLRVTIEMLPKGDESRARTIGLIEIANVKTSEDGMIGDYAVVLTKTPPFSGALKAAWKRGVMQVGHEDEEIIVGAVEGLHRVKRGSYDLLYRALKACGMDRR